MEQGDSQRAGSHSLRLGAAVSSALDQAPVLNEVPPLLTVGDGEAGLHDANVAETEEDELDLVEDCGGEDGW